MPYSAAFTLAVTMFLFLKLFVIDAQAALATFTLQGFWIFISFLIAILTLAGAYLLRQEHHNLAGSIIILVVNVIGMAFVVGLFLGPLLGIISGMLGISEHEKLIKHHI
jgi:hypothetical protein